MIKIRNVVWSASMLLCYPLYAAGQLYLFISKQKESEFYTLINTYPNEWIVAHLFLLTSLVLLIPAFIGICNYFKNTAAYPCALISTFFITLSIIPLIGQFSIDLCLVEICKLPEDLAYKTIEKVQKNFMVRALFYDNSKLFFLFKYADLTLLGQVFLGIGLFITARVPQWAKVTFIVALLLTQLGILIDPFYGRIIKRGSYALISLSLLPIAINIWEGNQAKK